MASSVERTIGRMVDKVEAQRDPQTKVMKVVYWILVGLLIISAVFLPSVLKELLGFALYSLIPVAIFSVAILVLVMMRKKKYEKAFWQVRDISSKVNYVEVTDASEIEKFCNENSWVFGSKKEEIMPFNYNWLLTAGAIDANTKLNVYYMSAGLVKSRFTYRNDVKNQLTDDHEIFVVDLSELDMSEEIEDKLANEAAVVRPYEFYNWLTKNFIVTGLSVSDEEDDEENDEDEVEAAEEEYAKESVGEENSEESAQ